MDGTVKVRQTKKLELSLHHCYIGWNFRIVHTSPLFRNCTEQIHWQIL